MDTLSLEIPKKLKKYREQLHPHIMLFSFRRALAVAVAALATTTSALPQTQTTPEPPANSSSADIACNNSPTLCNRQYSAITHMGAHNSAFLRDKSTGDSLAGNQFRNATFALDAGLRLLQAQVHKEDNVLRLCHTSCALLDAGTLQAWLNAVNSWMVANPNEVVTILLVNSDKADISEFAAQFQTSGLSKLGYTPASTGEWPTLQAMISQGTRLVSFITNIQASPTASYLLPEFTYVFETAFEVTEFTGFNCTLDRPSRLGSATAAIAQNHLGLVNHFKGQAFAAGIVVPDAENIDIVNSAATTAAGNLGRHLQACNREWSRQPTFVLVDFWDRGQTVAAADAMNGINDATGRLNSAAVDNDNESTGSNGNDRNLERGALLAFLVATLLIL